MAVFRESVPRDLRGKLMELNWTLVLLLVLLGGAGVGMLYSVAGGSWTPWAVNHAIRFSAAFGGFPRLSAAFSGFRRFFRGFRRFGASLIKAGPLLGYFHRKQSGSLS